MKNELPVFNSSVDSSVSMHISRGAFAEERESFPACCIAFLRRSSRIDTNASPDNPNKI